MSTVILFVSADFVYRQNILFAIAFKQIFVFCVLLFLKEANIVLVRMLVRSKTDNSPHVRKVAG